MRRAGFIKVTVFLPPEIHAAAVAMADGISLSSWIADLVARECGYAGQIAITKFSRRDKELRVAHGGLNAEYGTWRGILQRCNNPKTPGFENYGGRGILVCERWASSFAAFFADMGLRPSLKHSIDRMDNEGGYEPGNCRWATRSQQMTNRRPRAEWPSTKRKIRLA